MSMFANIESLGSETAENPYLPYLAAIEKGGIIDSPETMAEELAEPAGVYIANGLIPNNRGAGIVAIGNELAAYDLSRIAFERKHIEVTPTPKAAVEHDSGRITQEGGIVLEMGDGRIKLAGLAIDVTRQPWLASTLLGDRFRPLSRRIAVVALGSLDVPDYEITDLNVDTGVIRARETQKIYGFENYMEARTGNAPV
jgi:hypothetical protein